MVSLSMMNLKKIQQVWYDNRRDNPVPKDRWNIGEKMITLWNYMSITLCTGYGETIIERKVLEIGIKKYIQKPVNHEN